MYIQRPHTVSSSLDSAEAGTLSPIPVQYCTKHCRFPKVGVLEGKGGCGTEPWAKELASFVRSRDFGCTYNGPTR